MSTNAMSISNRWKGRPTPTKARGNKTRVQQTCFKRFFSTSSSSSSSSSSGSSSDNKNNTVSSSDSPSNVKNGKESSGEFANYATYHTNSQNDLHKNREKLHHLHHLVRDFEDYVPSMDNVGENERTCQQCLYDPLHLRSHINWEIPQNYNWEKASADNYAKRMTQDQVIDITTNQKEKLFYEFEFAKSVIDYKYHGYYAKSRQLNVHNTIIKHYTNSIHPDLVGPELKENPWVVFTAGPMGAGKTHTIRSLSELGIFPLSSFMHLSPDRVKKFLPEYLHYLNYNSEKVGKNLRREAGYICEIIFWELLQQNANIWNDTSMRTGDYFEKLFKILIQHYKNHKICLIYVKCDDNVVFERCRKRSLYTKRIVPTRDILDSIKRVPRSVALLKNLCHLYVEIDSNHGPDLKYMQFNDAENQKIIQKIDDPDWIQFKNIWHGQDPDINSKL